MLSDGRKQVNLLPSGIVGQPHRLPFVGLASGALALQNGSNLDARASIRFAFSSGSHRMKTSFRLLAAVFVLGFATFVQAGDFVSRVVQVGDMFTIDVPGNKFLVIRNFTQEGPSVAVTVRGMITATDRSGLKGTVITATIAETDPLVLLEPVNDVVVAGPSTVTVTGGDTTCFITYRKGEQ